jgi:protein involved in ribonucleotide reduction
MDCHTSNGRLLHEAVAGGQVQVADFLISKGFPVDMRDGSGSTPLHHQWRETCHRLSTKSNVPWLWMWNALGVSQATKPD